MGTLIHCIASIILTHSSIQAAAAKQKQARELVEFVKTAAGEAGTAAPILICGDFNMNSCRQSCTREYDAMLKLFKESFAVPVSDLVDVFAGDSGPPWTICLAYDRTGKEIGTRFPCCSDEANTSRAAVSTGPQNCSPLKGASKDGDGDQDAVVMKKSLQDRAGFSSYTLQYLNMDHLLFVDSTVNAGGTKLVVHDARVFDFPASCSFDSFRGLSDHKPVTCVFRLDSTAEKTEPTRKKGFSGDDAADVSKDTVLTFSSSDITRSATSVKDAGVDCNATVSVGHTKRSVGLG